MCLIKKHKFPRITIFPKTVYKIVEPLCTVDNTFSTSYRNITIKLGKTYKGAFRINNNIFKTINEYNISDGFIHSYDNIFTAKLEKCSYQNIIKCKIPAFTLYYKGIDNDIASRKLKYIKVCVD